MKHMKSAAGMAVVIAAAIAASGTAQAQSKPVGAWQPTKQEPDPAKRLPATQQSTQVEEAQQPLADVAPQQYASPSVTLAPYEEGRGGFFIGVKGGKGWVYDDVDQSAREINAGYRWQAGRVALVGIEVAGGKLKETVDDRGRYEDVDYASIGVNARFNFGASSPLYGLVRAGYVSADSGHVDVDGGYVGLGLGLDLSRHFNVSLVYTNYVYFNEAYWQDGEFIYDADRADTLMLGVEARF